MKANVFNNFYATTGVVDDGRGGATVLKVGGGQFCEASGASQKNPPPPLFGQWGGQNIA